jgi:glycosyltransferase involved in cell wall biosynthesis
MDYPFEAALESALSVCDEAVVIVGQSEDDTRDWVYSLAHEHKGRVIVGETVFTFDRGWQERWWNTAASLTDADWLFYHDADDVIHEDDVPTIRAMMESPSVKIISFPFIHFYMTPNYYNANHYSTAPRLGRRSAGWRMRNWCTDDFPNRPACQMVWRGDERAAAGPPGAERSILNCPIYHYSWVRDPIALQISQYKHKDWYSDGKRYNLSDGRVPDAEPYPFEETFPSIYGDYVHPYEGDHPAAIKPWMEEHDGLWVRLEREVAGVW